MENKNCVYSGWKGNGFVALFLILAAFALGCYLIYYSVMIGDAVKEAVSIVLSIVIIVSAFVALFGFMLLEPNEARVLLFFGKYRGNFLETGFWWINPFMSAKNISLRARNLNAEPIKVNDKSGNPILIGMVLVWKLEDSYKALFEIDTKSFSPVSSNPKEEAVVSAGTKLAVALEKFVRVQSDAALRQVAGCYAYDNPEGGDALSLRSNADEINIRLVASLNERLSMAGIKVLEARINYLAYAPEIAAVMLRRQQADAIISAREKIVQGAVGMVKMALDSLKDEGVVDLDEERKAAMVSNLLVVLCGDQPAQPVVNSGTLY